MPPAKVVTSLLVTLLLLIQFPRSNDAFAAFSGNVMGNADQGPHDRVRERGVAVVADAGTRILWHMRSSSRVVLHGPSLIYSFLASAQGKERTEKHWCEIHLAAR